MYCTKLLTDVGKNFLSISFLKFGTHMPMYSYLFENLLFFAGRGVKQSRQNMVYIAMCVNTYVLNLAFSSCECIFLLIFIESFFLLGLFMGFFFPYQVHTWCGSVHILSVIPVPSTFLLVKQSH